MSVEFLTTPSDITEGIISIELNTVLAEVINIISISCILSNRSESFVSPGNFERISVHCIIWNNAFSSGYSEKLRVESRNVRFHRLAILNYQSLNRSGRSYKGYMYWLPRFWPTLSLTILPALSKSFHSYALQFDCHIAQVSSFRSPTNLLPWNPVATLSLVHTDLTSRKLAHNIKFYRSAESHGYPFYL